MLLALVIPAAYTSAKSIDSLSGYYDDTKPGVYEDGLLIISRGTSVILLVVYVAHLVFQVRGYIPDVCLHIHTHTLDNPQLRTHKFLFRAPEEERRTPAYMSTLPAALAYV